MGIHSDLTPWLNGPLDDLAVALAPVTVIIIAAAHARLLGGDGGPGHRSDLVREALAGRDVLFAEQSEQLGTGHAVQMAWPSIEAGPETLLVLAGDMPLIRTATLGRLLERHDHERNSVTFLSGVLADPSGYGRVIRDSTGAFVKIVEERDTTAAERLVSEVNSAIYCFARNALGNALGFLRADNRQEEYYLTDTLSILRTQGGRIGVERASDPRELFGVNTPEQLRMVEEALRAYGET